MDKEAKMDEEKFGEIEYKKTHDITNGASKNRKRDSNSSLWEEYKQIISLINIHSRLYIAKFLFLVIIVVPVACMESDSYHTLIVSSFTLLGSLLFDQFSKKNIADNFDFKKAEGFCDIMVLYIGILFLSSITLLILEDRLFPIEEGTKKIMGLSEFKLMMFFLLCSSSFSALVEAIVNIPEEALPSRQQKTGKVKL